MPNLHPFFVHFPIALLTVGLIADVWALLRGEDHLGKLGWWLQAAGTLGLLIAVGTGIFAGQSAIVPEGGKGIFETHQQGALISAAVFASLALWRVGSRGNIAGARRMLFLLLYAAGVGAVLFTGWYGGKLVFEFGVGVFGNVIR